MCVVDYVFGAACAWRNEGRCFQKTLPVSPKTRKQRAKSDETALHFQYIGAKPKEACCKKARRPNEVRNVTACVIRQYRTPEINWQY